MEHEIRANTISFSDLKKFTKWLRDSALNRYSDLSKRLHGVDRTRGAEHDEVEKFIKLRNGLVHFYPEWSVSVKEQLEHGKHPEIVASLPELPLSPFISGTADFPLKYATHVY